MIHHDRFERELERGLAPRPAPAALRRRLARIPLEHPQGMRDAARWRRWLRSAAAPWTAGAAAALASLAVGFWLGSSGILDASGAADIASDEELVALVFPGVPATMGDYQ